MFSFQIRSLGDVLPAEEREQSAGHELKGKPTANFPREEVGRHV